MRVADRRGRLAGARDRPTLQKGFACSPVSSPPLRSAPTATFPVAFTTPLRPASRPSPSPRSARRSPTTTTRTSGLVRRSSRSSAPSLSSTTCGCCGPTTSSPRTSRSTPSCTPSSTRPPSRRRLGHQGLLRRGAGPGAARQDRRDRPDLQGDQGRLSLAVFAEGPVRRGAAPSRALSGDQPAYRHLCVRYQAQWLGAHSRTERSDVHRTHPAYPGVAPDDR